MASEEQLAEEGGECAEDLKEVMSRFLFPRARNGLHAAREVFVSCDLIWAGLELPSVS